VQWLTARKDGIFLTNKKLNIMENKTELYKAIAADMREVKGIDKSMTVGEGKNAYKAVSDKDVKKVIGNSMNKHGLICLPKSYETTMNVERWEEDTNYGKKRKQSVFVEASCVFSIIHVESGQIVDIPAYGHGIDSQDKAAGKATTYALKYALLYSFLVPTGSIDDADETHSNEQPTPPAKKPVTDFEAMKKAVTNDPSLLTKIVAQYELSAVQLDDLQTLISK